MPATHTTPSMRPKVSTASLHDRRAAFHRRDRLRVGGGPAAGGRDLGDHAVGDLARRLVAVDAHAVVVHDHGRALRRARERDGPPDPRPAPVIAITLPSSAPTFVSVSLAQSVGVLCTGGTLPA